MAESLPNSGPAVKGKWLHDCDVAQGGRSVKDGRAGRETSSLKTMPLKWRDGGASQEALALALRPHFGQGRKVKQRRESQKHGREGGR